MAAEKEMQAHDMVRRRSWARAVALYDQILAGSATSLQSQLQGQPNGTTRAQKDQQIACLLGRCECLLELCRYELCLADAYKVLTLLAEQTECLASVSRARRWLVHALFKLHKYSDAEHFLSKWINELSGQQIFSDISKTLERYKSIIQMIMNGHNKPPSQAQKIPHARLEDEMAILDTKLDHWATNNLPLDKYSKLLSNKGLKKREQQQHQQQQQQHQQQQQQQNQQQNGSGSFSSSSSTGSTSTMSSSSISAKNNELLSAIKLTGVKHQAMEAGQDAEQAAHSTTTTTCSYCAISFQTRNELRQHCQTESHQKVIMSDEGRDWKWRPPPRGYTLDTYSLCETFTEAQTCHYGAQCVEAHGQDELNEWKERFEYRRMRVQKACEKELYGKSYTEQVLERWIQATAPERVMCEKVPDIEAKCEQELVTSISSKTSKREWLFQLETARPLKAVALLQDAHRNHFALKSIKLGNGTAPSETEANVELKSDQEWVASSSAVASSEATSEEKDSSSPTKAVHSHEITIEFHTEIYGTFRQSICFDIGQEPLLVRHLCVDVLPVSDAEKIEEIKRDIINSSATRWDVANTDLTRFETTIGTHLQTEAYHSDLQHERELLERYPCPRAATFTLTQSTIVEKRLTQNNYRSRTHELLYVEEIARYEQIARFNVRTRLTVASNYILTPAGMATSTAKYSLAGELFALMRLGKDISEDTSPGRLILSNCSSVYISAPEDASKSDKSDKDKTENPRAVYEALIEDKGKNVIYLKLSSKCVEAMGLQADTELEVDIQFQLNRMPYCEWHNAVDKITDFRLIFPATELEPAIPWTPKKQWADACEPKLNAKQREAVNAITTALSIKLPPILLIGPFGTGKTYTLAQAIKQLLAQPEAKILICTHSNSAADLYIKEYLHPWIEEGLEEATPLRVYYHKRWSATVNSVVQKYCITDGVGNFKRPSIEDIMRHRIVVVTLSISMELATLGLPKGLFTHIFLDEAAQAMECEAIMPLALANDSTRIVLAGDHMQMSPELFSAFAKERKLHISLLERLYDHYPSNFPCKILLCENYRAHEAIIKFTSELFYEQKLIASGKQPRHERFYPLTFFTTRGEDVQDKNSTAFYNNAEVYEVVERVSELRKRWPSAWGKLNDTSIGIMTPYADQVFRIRSELRKRRMGGISVERVLNVQGKQFRAVFLSTVRTRRTCLPQASGPGNAGASIAAGSVGDTDTDYGFLSNSKLLNTAITRAQSLVAVVGDPVALCSIGRCRKVWERFIEICDEHKSLFGLTWSNLRSQLDGVEMKRGYVLNPLAPEFVPRALQPEAYLREQAAVYLNAPAHAPPGGQPNHFAAAAGMGPGPAAAHQMNQMAAMTNQQLTHMYSTHMAAMMAAAVAAGGKTPNGPSPGPGPGPVPHLRGHMGMRGPPPQGPPPGPPHLRQSQPGAGGPPPPPYGQYAALQHWRPPVTPQQAQQQQQQNPNASLWGPPPQTNPWSVLPPNKQQPPQQTGVPNRGPGPMPPPTLRGGSVPPAAPNATAAAQLLRNPSELGYLAKKTLYNHGQAPPAQQPPPPHHLYGQPPMPIQRGSSVPNGPMSPMENGPPPYLRHNGAGSAYNNYDKTTAVPPQQPPPAPYMYTSGKQPSPSALRFPAAHELLPPNVSIYEMAFNSQEEQYKWYLKLLESVGQDAANKFGEMLRQVVATMQQQSHQQQQQQQHPQGHKPPQQPTAPGPQMLTNPHAVMGPQAQQRPQYPMMYTGPGQAQSQHPVESSPPLDNFNQQIDLVFNSIMNGANDIAQPILRDVLGMVGVNAAAAGASAVSIPVANGMMNGGELQHAQQQHKQQQQQHQQHQQQQHQQQQQQQHQQQQQQQQQHQQQQQQHQQQSRLFAMMQGQQQAQQAPLPLAKHVPPNQGLPQQPNMYANHMAGPPPGAPAVHPGSSTNLAGMPNFMNNAAMLNDKSYNNFNSHGNNSGINSNGVHNNGSSVPLYRRQPMTGAGNVGNNNYSNLPGLFAGLDTGTNLIEALFQANNAVAGDHSSKSDPHNQSLIYNNYNALKNTHELDLFASVAPQPPNSQVPGAAGAAVDSINHPQSSAATTYAAVLSQGPQQQQVTGAQVAQHQQQARTMHAANKSSQSNNDLLEKDPFAAIRELGQATTGFYNYFQ